MKNRRLLFAILVLIMVILAGCGGASKGSAPSAPSPDTSYPEKPAQDRGDSVVGSPPGGGGQYMIRTANISLDVEKLDDVLAEINAAVLRAGGYMMQSNIGGPGENRRAHLTLRVPEAGFNAFLDEIEAFGKRVNRSTGGDDVTLNYVDLEARIRNLEHQEKRLLSILDKAETIEDILRVEQELWRIRGQLESLTAEFRYLRDRVQYATVYVDLRETPAASNVITGSGLKGVWQRGWAGFVKTVNTMLTGIGSILVFLLTALPYLVFLLIVAAAYFRFRKKTKKVAAPLP